ncbi:potassium channel family protein [Mesobacterium sp. TK19101]|uniref:Potassium channel family protein n=1 Tax=Mesobacterium hydrothermale TaxID=3111907 RepID=A0ABU6HEF0_9RHOB|nr:potassium channel family protein [Mesobacterium sp. TK19101]MEC3860761.1 potassium channel family protein [Mesobacterium sp. TK19101]
MSKLTERLHELYEGETDRAHRFRYALLVFDIVTILFVIATSFSTHGPVIETIDAVFGVVILIDFIARLWIEKQRLRYLVSPATLADIVAIGSFLAPLAGEGLGFLRVLRTLRLLRTYQLMNRLRSDFSAFRRNEEVVIAAVNLLVFLFVMTGLIYATQYPHNPDIRNYADALYFTVTTLTTTGFGDITLTGTWGRMLSVVVMIFGVTLFLRLAQVLFRPTKVRQKCHRCGLLMHDADAVHCKHCGAFIHIETEGLE